MSPTVNLIVFIIGLVVIIAGSPKINMNMGLVAVVLAFIIGRFFGGVNGTTVMSYFPIRLAIIFILSGAFFGYVKRTGMFKSIGDRVLWAFRKSPQFIPFAIFLTAFVVSGLGAGGFIAPTIVSPIAFELASIVGFNPVLASIATFVGTFSAGNLPWQSGVVSLGEFGVQYLGEDMRIPIILMAFAILGGIWLIALIVQYIITGGYKVKQNANLDHLTPPEPLTADQKRSLIVIVAFIVCAALPSIINMFFPNPVTKWFTGHFEIYALFGLGMLAMNLLKVADANVVFKEDIPWGMMMTVCGVGMYVGLITPLGCVDLLAEWVGIAPQWAVFPMLFLVGGFLAAFCNGLVVVQALIPIYVAAITAFPGLSPVGGLLAIWCGQGLSSGSPFSTGGAMSLTGCTDDSLRNKVVSRMVVNWICVLACGTILALIGFFNWF